MQDNDRLPTDLGELITRMLHALRRQKGWSMTETMEHASSILEISPSSIHKWRDNSLKPQSGKLEALMELGAREAKMDRDWAEAVLRLGDHPEPKHMLDRYFAPIQRVRHNLPRQPFTPFFRKNEAVQVGTWLAQDSGRWVIPLVGINGLGKTTLALQVAWEYVRQDATLTANERFDNIVFISAKHARLTPTGVFHTTQHQPILDEIYEVLCQVLDSPGAPDTSEEQKLQAIVQLLAHSGPTLLIIDDVELIIDDVDKKADAPVTDNVDKNADAEVTALLAMLPTSTKTIVTTEWNHWPNPLQLRLLDESEISQLIEAECRARGVNLQEHQIQELAQNIGGVPLAAWWAASQIALFGYGEKQVISKLHSVNEPLLPFVFADILQGLKKKNLVAYFTLLALSFFSSQRGPTLDVLLKTVDHVVGTIPNLMMVLQLDPAPTLKISEDECTIALNLLQNFRLVTTPDPIVSPIIAPESPLRFPVLRLAKPYLQAHAQTQEADWEEAARSRWLIWNLEFARQHGENIGKEWHIQYDELEDEWLNLLSVSRWCIRHQHYQDLARLWLDDASLARFTDIYGHWLERRYIFRWLADQARNAEEWTRLAIAELNLATTLLLTYHADDWLDIENRLTEAWEIAQHHYEAIPWDLTCLIAEQWAFWESRRKNFGQAEDWMVKVRTMLDEMEPRAHDPHDQDQHLKREWPRREAGYWYRLGTIHYFAAYERDHHTQAYDEAAACFKNAIHFGDKADRHRVILAATTWLAEIAIAQGRYEEARGLLDAHFAEALRNHEKRRIASFHRAYAHYERHMGNLPKARDDANTAYSYFKQLSMGVEMAQVQVILDKINESEQE